MLSIVKKYRLLLLILLLLMVNFFVFYQDFKNSHRGLTFAMLNIGQGDALFIESPTGTQILVDGGPPRKILSELSRVMSPFDRKLDGILITNPDQDHIAGFLDVLKIYKVGMALEPGTLNDSKTYRNLEEEMKRKNIRSILARSGMKLHLGGGATMEILFPDRDVSTWPNNDGSVVARLSYGNTSVMLMGDASKRTEEIVLGEKRKLQSTVLKVGHHGSRSSTSEDFVRAVSPKYALISDGRNNKYGHPHQETLNTLASFGAKVFRTDILGTIVMKSYGKTPVFYFNNL